MALRSRDCSARLRAYIFDVMSNSEAVIVWIVTLGFPWLFYAAWPYSGLFFLVLIIVAGIWQETRDAVRRRVKLRADQPPRA